MDKEEHKLAIDILKDNECVGHGLSLSGVQLRYGITIEKIIKAMQQYHEAKLKEELIKFLRKREYPGDSAPDIMIENIVLEYLKQRNNGDN